MKINNIPPLVCICIPTFNTATTVGETLASILKQSYSNMVIHVVDNASTDDTLTVVEAFQDRRIRIHRNEKNIGGEGNFTRCLGLAEGDYTTIFHADDLYEFDMIEKQVAFLEDNRDIGAVFTQAHLIDENGRQIGRTGTPPGRQPGIARYDFIKLLRTMLLHHNFLVCPSAMARTQIYRSYIREWGSSAFLSSSDVDTWLRLAQCQPIAVLDKPLMSYRIGTAQFSERIRNRTERTDFFLVMDEYLSRPEVANMLKKEDIEHYGWLLRHEQVTCAMNLYASERFDEARGLLDGVLSSDALRAAFYTRRGRVTLAATLLMSLFGRGSPLKARLVKSLKKLSWK